MKNRLTYIKNIDNSHCQYQCSCGNTIIASKYDVAKGHTVSCGCYRKEQSVQRATKHGLRQTKLYSVYTDMKTRCYNKNSTAYKYYGGRGIRVCSDWLTFEGFHLWAVSQGIDENCCDKDRNKLTIERNDVDGHYEPDNCTWIPKSDQCKNRSNVRKINDCGIDKCLKDYCRDHNLNYNTINSRINRSGWDIETALSKINNEFTIDELIQFKNKFKNLDAEKPFILTVTGHRPQKLGGFGNETFDLLVNLAMSQFNAIRPDKVITGMALGWDQAVAEACINMQIPFIAAIPTPLQSNRWFPESVKRYEYQLSKAEKVVDTSLDIHGEGHTISVPQAMQERNMWMVDRCTAVLALWDGSTGGTGNCVRYTNSKQIPIANCWNQFQRIRNEQSRSH